MRSFMSAEPENLVLELLRGIRADMVELKTDASELKTDMSDVKSDMHSLRADVASDFLLVRREIKDTRQEMNEKIVGLRRAFIEYHSSIIGHGVLITELDERMRRVEQHLNLPVQSAH
jgi:hypothetical protein